MKGFFLEQSGHNAEGFAYSSRALASDPGNLYAYHAVGHAYISRGDYREALETFETPHRSSTIRISCGI